MKFFNYYRSQIGSENKRCAAGHRLILVVLAAAILSAVVSCVIHRKAERVVDSKIFGGEVIQENGVKTNDGAYYINENLYADAVLFLTLEEMQIGKGSYRLTVCYENTETNGVIYLVDDVEWDKHLTMADGENYLRRERYSETFEFCTKDTKTDLHVKLFFMGTGELTVHSVVLEKTNNFYINRLWNVLLCALVVTGCYYCAYLNAVKTRRERFTFIFLIGTVVIASYPLFVEFLYSGHDIDFHLKRIEGLKAAILSGQIPARVQPLWYFDAGYATSLYYCDMPLIFPALLRVMGVPVQTAWQMFLVLVNILTCLISYYSLSRMTQNRMACLTGTFLYTNSIYRLNSIYCRAAAGEFCAMIFLPLVVYGMWLILHTDIRTGKKINVFPLTIGMTGVILSHVLSTEMIGILLIVTCLIFCKKIFKEKRFFYLIKAAVWTLLLSAWFLIPFVLEFSQIGGVNAIAGNIGNTGTSLAQLFTTFYGKGGAMITSVGLPVLIAVFFLMLAGFVTGCYKDGKCSDFRFVFLLGLLCLTFSSRLFPWDSLGEYFVAHHMPFVSRMIGSVQFLWRWVGVGAALLCVAVALGLDRISYIMERRYYETMVTVILAFGVIGACYYNDSFMHNQGEWEMHVYSEADVLKENGGKGDGLYLPDGSKEDSFVGGLPAPYTVSGSEVRVTCRRGQTIILEIADKTDDVSDVATDTVILPYIYYDGYTAKDNATGEKYETYCTDNYTLGVRIPSDYSGVITVRYEGKWYWRIAEMISLMAFVYLMWKFCRRKRV